MAKIRCHRQGKHRGPTILRYTLHLRLEAANDIDDVQQLDGVLVEQQALVRDGGVFALLHRGPRLEANYRSENVLQYRVRDTDEMIGLNTAAQTCTGCFGLASA